MFKVGRTLILALLLIAFVLPVNAAGEFPAIDKIKPHRPSPGQLITIYGQYFLTETTCPADQLQVWFISQEGGVNWVSASTQGVNWDQESIQLKVPSNLTPGVKYRVTVIRCNLGSVTTPYYLTLKKH